MLVATFHWNGGQFTIQADIWKASEQICPFWQLLHPFGCAVNVVDKKRVRLKPENLDLLVSLRGNKHFMTWD
jgi:hypothetical protein